MKIKNVKMHNLHKKENAVTHIHALGKAVIQSFRIMYVRHVV